jgi:hypothetical protein
MYKWCLIPGSRVSSVVAEQLGHSWLDSTASGSDLPLHRPLKAQTSPHEELCLRLRLGKAWLSLHPMPR